MILWEIYFVGQTFARLCWVFVWER